MRHAEVGVQVGSGAIGQIEGKAPANASGGPYFRARILGLLGTAVALVASAIWLRGSGWTSSESFHGTLEAFTASWALGVGSIALVRYYTRKDDSLLFVATGFLGAGILDGYHTAIALSYASTPFPSTLSAFVPWSWMVSRLFLSVLLWLGGRPEAGGEGKLRARSVYIVAGALMLASFLLFALVPLPPAYFPELWVHRPQELLSALFFLLGLAGYLRRSAWRKDSLEYSLVLSCLVGFLSEALFMSFSMRLSDAMFDAAHLLKGASYATVLSGLMMSMFHLFRQAEESAAEMKVANELVRAEVSERRRVEEELRRANESLERRVEERTRDLEASRKEALRAMEAAQNARHHAEGAERRFRDLVESAPDAMVVVDRWGTIRLVNTVAAKLFGYEREELVGKTVEVLVPESARASHVRERSRYLDAPSVRAMGVGLDLEGRRKDGSVVPIEISLSPIETEEGTLVSAGIHDLTERRSAEEKIARYVRELERSNEELSQFAYVASHDLQEPLRMVTSFTQLLAKRYQGKLGPEADEFIGHAVDGARRMQDLIQGLLAYSRVQTKGARFEWVPAETALERALQNLRVAIEESGARVTHDSLPRVKADPTQLVQLFQNLVGNAVKFRAEAPPEVHVSAARDDGAWVFSVRDNGIGIEPRYADRVFKIFKRLHHRNDYPGTGIGLAICKRIVERHGGKIWFESAPGEGSVFRFTLPDEEETP